jgi:serine/threonine-protein kinase
VLAGTTIEHYEILERLGQGGMGDVYRAADLLLEREVALKLLRPEYATTPEFAERFRAEAVTLAKLSHPHIAALFGVVRDSAQLCMVMELTKGETLGALMKRTGALSWERAILLTGQMLDALHYAHERGVVHRDIKPSNLMVGPDDQLKLMDFGIARLMGTTRVTRLGFSVGTLEYMAPEQIRGEDVDGRADIYATGVVLYEMVTGQLPFAHSREQALMFAHLQQEVVPPRLYRPNLPWRLSDVIVRALAKAPSDRFATAREFSDALGASSSSATTVAIRVPEPDKGQGDLASTVPIATDRDDARAKSTGWVGRWWPRVRLSSNRFGGAKEAGVIYQAAASAGGFGGAIRVVAVQMGTAGRRAASQATRRPFLVAAIVVVALLGQWQWRQRRAKAAEIATPPLVSASVPATTHVTPPIAPPIESAPLRAETRIATTAKPRAEVKRVEPIIAPPVVPVTPVMTPPAAEAPPAELVAPAPPPAPDPIPVRAAPAPAPATALAASWSKTFEFDVFRGTRVLHVAPDRIRYEMRDTNGRAGDDGFTASCADIAEWTAGRFKGSLHVQLTSGKKLDFNVSGQKLTDMLDSYAAACGRH